MPYDPISVYSTLNAPTNISWVPSTGGSIHIWIDGLDGPVIIYPTRQAAKKELLPLIVETKHDLTDIGKADLHISTRPIWFYNRAISEHIGVNNKSKYCAWVTMYTFYMDASVDDFLKNTLMKIHNTLAVKVSHAMANVNGVETVVNESYEKQPETILEFLKSIFVPLRVEKDVRYYTADVSGINLKGLTTSSVNAVLDKMRTEDVKEICLRNAVSFFKVSVLRADDVECLKILKI